MTSHPSAREQLDELVRDLTSVVPRPKSEVRRRLLEFHNSRGIPSWPEWKAAYDEGVKAALAAIPKVRVFELRHDNSQYSLGQTNGYYIATEDFKKAIEALLGSGK